MYVDRYINHEDLDENLILTCFRSSGFSLSPIKNVPKSEKYEVGKEALRRTNKDEYPEEE